MPDDIRLKIQRASKHINELHGVVQEFKKTNPYKVDSKRDPQTGEHIVYIHSADPIPPTIPIIAGDVIQNLYSSLDYLASKLVIANGNKPTSKTAFPITKNIPTTKDEVARYEGQVSGMRQEVKDLLKGMNLYRGANNSFWRLHKLNNINKHRSLVTMGFQPSSFGAWGDLIDQVKMNFGPLEQGSEVARFPPDAENHKDVHFVIDIAISEPEADAVDYPLIVALRLCHNTVKRAVHNFEIYR